MYEAVLFGTEVNQMRHFHFSLTDFMSMGNEPEFSAGEGVPHPSKHSKRKTPTGPEAKAKAERR